MLLDLAQIFASYRGEHWSLQDGSVANKEPSVPMKINIRGIAEVCGLDCGFHPMQQSTLLLR